MLFRSDSKAFSGEIASNSGFQRPSTIDQSSSAFPFWTTALTYFFGVLDLGVSSWPSPIGHIIAAPE